MAFTANSGARRKPSTPRKKSNGSKNRAGFGKITAKSTPAFVSSVLRRSGLKGFALSQAISALNNRDIIIKLGREVYEALQNPDNQVIGGEKSIAAETLSGIRTLSGGNGLVASKVQKIHFTAGTPPVRAARDLIRTNGNTSNVLVETIRNNETVSERLALTSTFGFNQMRQMLVDTDIFGYNLKEAVAGLGLTLMTDPEKKIQNSYWMATRLRNKMTISNDNRYLPVEIKLSLCTLQDEIAFCDVVDRSVNTSLISQSTAAMPRFLQLGLATTSFVGKSVLVDPTTPGMKASPNFRGKVEIVKTFKRKILSGDALEFTYDHLFGSGLRVEPLYGMHKDSNIDNNYPLVYALMVEMKGIPCEVFNSTNLSAKYRGTSPGEVSFEFKKTIHGARSSTNSNNQSPLGGYYSQLFAVRTYTKRVTEGVNKIFNVNHPIVMNGYDLKVMSDALMRDAGTIQ